MFLMHISSHVASTRPVMLNCSKCRSTTRGTLKIVRIDVSALFGLVLLPVRRAEVWCDQCQKPRGKGDWDADLKTLAKQELAACPFPMWRYWAFLGFIVLSFGGITYMVYRDQAMSDRLQKSFFMMPPDQAHDILSQLEAGDLFAGSTAVYRIEKISADVMVVRPSSNPITTEDIMGTLQLSKYPESAFDLPEVEISRSAFVEQKQIRKLSDTPAPMDTVNNVLNL